MGEKQKTFSEKPLGTDEAVLEYLVDKESVSVPQLMNNFKISRDRAKQILENTFATYDKETDTWTPNVNGQGRYENPDRERIVSERTEKEIAAKAAYAANLATEAQVASTEQIVSQPESIDHEATQAAARQKLDELGETTNSTTDPEERARLQGELQAAIRQFTDEYPETLEQFADIPENITRITANPEAVQEGEATDAEIDADLAEAQAYYSSDQYKEDVESGEYQRRLNANKTPVQRFFEKVKRPVFATMTFVMLTGFLVGCFGQGNQSGNYSEYPNAHNPIEITSNYNYDTEPLPDGLDFDTDVDLEFFDNLDSSAAVSEVEALDTDASDSEPLFTDNLGSSSSSEQYTETDEAGETLDTDYEATETDDAETEDNYETTVEAIGYDRETDSFFSENKQGRGSFGERTSAEILNSGDMDLLAADMVSSLGSNAGQLALTYHTLGGDLAAHGYSNDLTGVNQFARTIIENPELYDSIRDSVAEKLGAGVSFDNQHISNHASFYGSYQHGHVNINAQRVVNRTNNLIEIFDADGANILDADQLLNLFGGLENVATARFGSFDPVNNEYTVRVGFGGYCGYQPIIEIERTSTPPPTETPPPPTETETPDPEPKPKNPNDIEAGDPGVQNPNLPLKPESPQPTPGENGTESPDGDPDVAPGSPADGVAPGAEENTSEYDTIRDEAPYAGGGESRTPANEEAIRDQEEAQGEQEAANDREITEMTDLTNDELAELWREFFEGGSNP